MDEKGPVAIQIRILLPRRVKLELLISPSGPAAVEVPHRGIGSRARGSVELVVPNQPPDGRRRRVSRVGRWRTSGVGRWRASGAGIVRTDEKGSAATDEHQRDGTAQPTWPPQGCAVPGPAMAARADEANFPFGKRRR